MNYTDDVSQESTNVGDNNLFAFDTVDRVFCGDSLLCALKVKYTDRRLGYELHTVLGC